MNLGPIVRPLGKRELLMGSSGTCHDIICQYPAKYQTLLGTRILRDEQLNAIILLLKK